MKEEIKQLAQILWKRAFHFVIFQVPKLKIFTQGENYTRRLATRVARWLVLSSPRSPRAYMWGSSEFSQFPGPLYRAIPS